MPAAAGLPLWHEPKSITILEVVYDTLHTHTLRAAAMGVCQVPDLCSACLALLSFFAQNRSCKGVLICLQLDDEVLDLQAPQPALRSDSHQASAEQIRVRHSLTAAAHL